MKEKKKKKRKIKMHTHQADCVSERRLRPRRPELHSTTMSQGLPSVDTQQSHRCERVRETREAAGVTDRPIQQRGGDGEIAVSSTCGLFSLLCRFPFLFPSFKWPFLSLLLSLLLSFWLYNPPPHLTSLSLSLFISLMGPSSLGWAMASSS